MRHECSQCKTEFHANERTQPCPDCGNTGKAISKSVWQQINVRQSYEVSQQYAHTNRTVKQSPAELQAIDWSAAPSADELANHPVAQGFRLAIQDVPVLTSQHLTLFRGQCIRDDEQIPPSVDRIGPLRPDLKRVPREGRYNVEGERALYLADSVDGVRRELGSGQEALRFGIRLNVPLSPLRIADFSDFPSDHLVTAIFSRAEVCKVEARGGPENYLFSQTVGRIVAERFDGMRIPGVHGAPGAHYRNVVIFRGFDDWKSWLHQDKVFPILRTHHEQVALAAFVLWEDENYVHGSDQSHWFRAIRDLGGR